MRQFAKEARLSPFQVASCGMGDWHVGESPHAPMRRAAETRGFSLSSRAQQFRTSFFDQYDWILAADHEVYRDLLRLAATPEQKNKVVWMTEHSAKYPRQEIPDPYGADPQTFYHVLDILEDACRGWVQFLQKEHK